ncbi:hypothetical protein ASPWEDRAFT_177475 [Aspergillus wentii DTO 134E9]|uniref:C2H2-type domain-containing protein n=1 Tax=Aspergillus wentii DTO 134E9 TaxID=1073089 RepID=A0A1L9R4A2_ASPWE|nr:uncharacterized protein ASPWEDRAFT_177475 [Aspergillus wentii DTO 134E9]OJJ29734.1 hypothetical protein ASPWEDRAFT_177475 [Aspergillus wentii DTO 134E9]
MHPRKKSRPTIEKRGNPVDADTLHPISTPRGEERAFRCQFCAKAFLRKEHLQRHERLHTKEKPFRCTICSAGFARSDLLARHARLTHGSDSIATPGHENSSLIGASPEDLLRSGRQNQRPTEAMEKSLPESISTVNSDLSFQDLPMGYSSALPLTSPVDMHSVPENNTFGDFDLFIDSISGSYGSGLSSFFFEQPLLPSHPAPLFPTAESDPNSSESTARPASSHLYDEFTSAFPSFEPSPSLKAQKEPWKVTQQDWDHLLSKVQPFKSVIPPGFVLPSRHTMTRYITTYFTGFHRHLPFLHVPTFSGVDCPVELILAMATIGAQSAFDHHNAIMLFRASFAIAQERLCCRKEERRKSIYQTKKDTLGQSQASEPMPETPSTMRQQCDLNAEQTDQFNPLPLAQTLLIIMAMATWGNSGAIFDEAVGIQNILANYLRAEKLLAPQEVRNTPWKIWIHEEGFRRTIVVIFCFFMFYTIVYDTPPPILNSELNLLLPSREKEWEAQSEEAWKQARSEHEPECHFDTLYSMLFRAHEDGFPRYCSSLGSYTLILALIQHIYFLRSASKRQVEGDDRISPSDVTKVEQALRNWQSLWNHDPESFLGPSSPLGPISFNSTALLRMAYIRLHVDLGPWRALNTHDPDEVANSIYQSPPLTTNRKLTRAVLYSAHALSIPVKIGVNIVTHNQAFSWSLQHSLCALECAFIISKWLIAIEPHISNGAVDEEEARLYAYIEDMVTEAKAGGEIGSSGPDLCTQVVRIWARILSGKAVWNVVRMIGKVLEAYAQILERRLG